MMLNSAERERDRLWCTALVSSLDSDQLVLVLDKFIEIRELQKKYNLETYDSQEARIAELEEENLKLGELICDECNPDNPGHFFITDGNDPPEKHVCVCVGETESYRELEMERDSLKDENIRLCEENRQLRISISDARWDLYP